MIDTSRWRFTAARSCGEAVRELWSRGARVVFSERTLPDGEWRDILERIADLDEPPRFVVISKLADESFWLEVLQLGGYDVLSKPLVEDEVRNVLGSVPAHPVRPVRRTRLFVVRTRPEL
jgi:DNA-binding NtrC family response regulator